MRRDIESLLDILEACKRAISFTSGMTRDDFLDDERSNFAVMRAIEIIGEAANRVSDDLQDAHPELPWRDMITMRNRLIHVYDDVDLDLVWKTVQEDIPHLIRAVEPLVPGQE